MKTTINTLDPSQRHALEGVLNNKEDVAVIYGPPGTGKSHLILSLLFELAVRGDKVLFVSQNTEALNVIVRMYKKLDRELGINNEYALSFLDFCWCLNEPAEKRVTYIRQQKNRIMTKPINTLPYADDEEEDEIPYALTYRNLDRNENMNEDSEVIGFDELLASALKNIKDDSLIKDILHAVPDKSYRSALNLLNEFNDKNNQFSDLNHPKNALKYLTKDRIDYTLSDAKLIVEDVCEAADKIVSSRELVAKSEMNVNDYLTKIFEISEYAKIININHFDESGLGIKDLAKTVKERLAIDGNLEKTTEVSLDTRLSGPILSEKEDVNIIALDNLETIRDYSKVLTKVRDNIETLDTVYNVDKETRLKNLISVAFSSVDFGVFSTNSYSDFKALKSNDLEEILAIVDDYNSKNKLSKAFYKIPENIKVLNKKNIDAFVENAQFIKFLALILDGTNRTVEDIIACKRTKQSSILPPLDIKEYNSNAEKYAKLCNTVLYLLNTRLNGLIDYTLEEIENIISREISDIRVIFDTLSKNRTVEFTSVRDAISAINKNIHNKTTSEEHEKLDSELKPFFVDAENIEKSCEAIIELSKKQSDLRKLLDEISEVKQTTEIKLADIDKLRNKLIEAEQKGILSNEFFIIPEGENLSTWKNHINTVITYDKIDEFDSFISQNRFIKNLRETLSSKNLKVIDAYLADENITYDEFREHLTNDIVGTIYNNAPMSVRERIDKKYFANFRQNHKKLQIREYLSGLQKLKIEYEAPAKVLSYNANWKPATTNIERIRKNSEMITDAFPVTIATPADVSKYMSSKKAAYDYVIFDEASQLLPGQALPSIYRAKKAVIVGDPHQMPPTLSVSFGFNAMDGGLSDGFDSDEVSILDLAINLQLDATYHLKVHYRSESNKLFEPSLKAIYEKQGVQPIFEAENGEMPLYIEDNLGEDDNKNFASISRRVQYYLSKNEDATFCILFSRSDKAGVHGFRKYLEESADTTIAELYENDRILISTVTNCQGIEGDHTILYLPSYSSPKAMWFFKASAGAYKRLNVSITRQKKTLDVIMGDPKTKWISVCQDFLNDNNCDANQRTSAELLNTLLVNAGQEVDEGYLDQTLWPNNQNIDSPLIEQLYNRLSEYYSGRIGKDLRIWTGIGWNMVIPDMQDINKNKRNVGYKIDIGVYSTKQRRFILGIETDSSTYHKDFSKEFSDLQRQAVLAQKGWEIYRVWSSNWLRNTKKEFESLVSAIDNALDEEE